MSDTVCAKSSLRHLQEVMEVENTVSPKMLLGAPNDRPWKDWPVLRWRTAGAEVVLACVAYPRARRVLRMMVRASMVVEDSEKYLMTEERENEVTEVTARWV